MYNFHYDYIKPKYGEQGDNCLMTDTDSLIYEIQTDDFYKDIEKDIKTKFDTSAIIQKTIKGLSRELTKK